MSPTSLRPNSTTSPVTAKSAPLSFCSCLSVLLRGRSLPYCRDHDMNRPVSCKWPIRMVLAWPPRRSTPSEKARACSSNDCQICQPPGCSSVRYRAWRRRLASRAEAPDTTPSRSPRERPPAEGCALRGQRSKDSHENTLLERAALCKGGSVKRPDRAGALIFRAGSSLGVHLLPWVRVALLRSRQASMGRWNICERALSIRVTEPSVDAR